MEIQQRLYREVACWRNLKHPNVVELLGIARFFPNVPPGLVSKWALRNDFLKFIGTHPELKRGKVIHDVTRLVRSLILFLFPG